MSVVVDKTKTTVKVACKKTAGVVTASGETGLTSVTLTAAGPGASLIVSVRGRDGGSATYQAAQGLRNKAGKAIGSFTASSQGSAVAGKVTYLAVILDKSGQPAHGDGSAVPGSFDLSCPA